MASSLLVVVAMLSITDTADGVSVWLATATGQQQQQTSAVGYGQQPRPPVAAATARTLAIRLLVQPLVSIIAINAQASVRDLYFSG